MNTLVLQKKEEKYELIQCDENQKEIKKITMSLEELTRLKKLLEEKC